MNVRSVNLSPSAAEAAWAAANERVQCYLQAHRVTEAAQVSRLAADVIAIARARWQRGVDPTVAAMETLEACMSSWFGQWLPTEASHSPQALHRGRLALAVGEVPAYWPAHFLREGAAPEELIRVMRSAELSRGPAIRLSHMAAANPPVRERQGDAWYNRPFSWGTAMLQRLMSIVGATFAGGR